MNSMKQEDFQKIFEECMEVYLKKQAIKKKAAEDAAIAAAEAREQYRRIIAHGTDRYGRYRDHEDYGKWY